VIEINLHPEGARRGRRKAGPRRALALPKVPALGDTDPYLLGVGAAWLGGLALIAFLVFGVRAQKSSLQGDLTRARNDSIKYAAQIRDNEALRAQRDSVVQKLMLIQDLDDGRYVWSHILDEISRALPQYIWLTGVNQLLGDSLPVFQVQGHAGNNFALTEFMKDLEASAFIRNVKLARTEMIYQGDEVLNEFIVEGRYQAPPSDLIETIPLIAAQEFD
jgi:type IV pilus assembly protein PilN